MFKSIREINHSTFVLQHIARVIWEHNGNGGITARRLFVESAGVTFKEVQKALKIAVKSGMVKADKFGRVNYYHIASAYELFVVALHEHCGKLDYSVCIFAIPTKEASQYDVLEFALQYAADQNKRFYPYHTCEFCGDHDHATITRVSNDEVDYV